MASSSKVEVVGLFHNGKTDVPLHITINEISLPQLPTTIETGNSAAEVIVTTNVIQTGFKSMDIRLYWLKDRVKQIYFLYNGNQDAKT